MALKPDVSQEFLDELKKGTITKQKSLRNFPGWSERRLELVEKWQNHSLYTFNLRFEQHENAFADDNIRGFLDRIAANSETQGFVGIFDCSISDSPPSLILFENGKARLWDVDIYDPNSWAFGDWERGLDELKKDYDKACQLLKEGYEQKIKEFKARAEQEEV